MELEFLVETKAAIHPSETAWAGAHMDPLAVVRVQVKSSIAPASGCLASAGDCCRKATGSCGKRAFERSTCFPE